MPTRTLNERTLPPCLPPCYSNEEGAASSATAGASAGNSGMAQLDTMDGALDTALSLVDSLSSFDKMVDLVKKEASKLVVSAGQAVEDDLRAMKQDLIDNGINSLVDDLSRRMTDVSLPTKNTNASSQAVLTDTLCCLLTGCGWCRRLD